MGLFIKKAVAIILGILIHGSAIAAPSANPDPGEKIRIRYENSFIWLTALESDVMDLIEAISEKTDRKIKIINKQDHPAGKKISITIEEMTVDMAVKNICRALGLSYAILYDNKDIQTYCLFHPGNGQPPLSPENQPFPPRIPFQNSNSNPFSALGKIQQQENALPLNTDSEATVFTQQESQIKPEPIEKTETHLPNETENITMDSIPDDIPGTASKADAVKEEDTSDDLPPGTFTPPSSDLSKKPYFPFRAN